jgi:hypothetical protein
MGWFWTWQVFKLRRSIEGAKALEILLLRRQLAIYEQGCAPHLPRGEKLILLVLATKLKIATGRTIQAIEICFGDGQYSQKINQSAFDW